MLIKLIVSSISVKVVKVSGYWNDKFKLDYPLLKLQDSAPTR